MDLRGVEKAAEAVENLKSVQIAVKKDTYNTANKRPKKHFFILSRLVGIKECIRLSSAECISPKGKFRPFRMG